MRMRALKVCVGLKKYISSKDSWVKSMPWVNRVHRSKEFVGLRDLWLKRMSGLSGIGMPHTQIEQVHSEHACINKTRTAFLLRSRSNVKSKCTCHCQSFSTYSRVVQEYRSAHRRVQSFLLLNNRDLSWIAFYHSYKLLQRILLKCLRICWTY